MASDHEHAPAESAATAVWELSINLDDVTGEVIGDATQRLLEAGALDVWTQPIHMKKQRPGVILSLLADSANRDELARLTLELTGGLGLRYCEKHRLILERSFETVATPLGEVRMKLGRLNGRVITAKPELEDARRVAGSTGSTLRHVLKLADAAWQQKREDVQP